MAVEFAVLSFPGSGFFDVGLAGTVGRAVATSLRFKRQRVATSTPTASRLTITAFKGWEGAQPLFSLGRPNTVSDGGENRVLVRVGPHGVPSVVPRTSETLKHCRLAWKNGVEQIRCSLWGHPRKSPLARSELKLGSLHVRVSSVHLQFACRTRTFIRIDRSTQGVYVQRMCSFSPAKRS